MRAVKHHLPGAKSNLEIHTWLAKLVTKWHVMMQLHNYFMQLESYATFVRSIENHNQHSAISNVIF